MRQIEFDTMGMQRERDRMSPRAVEQGWTEELDKNLEEHRAQVTETKIKALFEVHRLLLLLLWLAVAW